MFMHYVYLRDILSRHLCTDDLVYFPITSFYGLLMLLIPHSSKQRKR